jgi:hypothetical protein
MFLIGSQAIPHGLEGKFTLFTVLLGSHAGESVLFPSDEMEKKVVYNQKARG